LIAAVHNPEVQDYIDGVLDGSIVAGRLVRLAVMRHVWDLETAEERGFYFDSEAAQLAIDFFPTVLRHSTGKWAGQPFELSPWQQFVVACIFGWRRIDSGLRRFRSVFLELARKNGKTALAAGLALMLMVLDQPAEVRAEIYCAATKEDQANLLHSEATRMVKASPSLRKQLKVHRKNLSMPSDDSFFRPIGSDSDTTDGFNPHGVFMDELHAWKEHHRGLHEKLTTGGASREQPLDVTITTAGDDNSILWIEQHDYCVRVLESVLTEQVFDDEKFAFIAAIDLGNWIDPQTGEQMPGDDPFDPECWPKSNPGYGVSVKPEYLESQARVAQNDATKKTSFLRYHCNVRVSASVKAIDDKLWANGKRELSDWHGQIGFGGIDLARSNDFAAITLVFPFYEMVTDGNGRQTREIEHIEVRSWAWTVKDRSEALNIPAFDRWIRSEQITVHEGNQIGFWDIRNKVVELSQEYNIKAWLFDPAFAKETAQILQEDHGLPMFLFSQFPKNYNEPTRKLLNLVSAGKVWHDGDEVLSWQAGNLVIKPDSREMWMPDKSSSKNKIDGMIALIMGLSAAMWDQGEHVPTYYETNEVEFV
jgi:phage terminase large subunit-like protein